MAAFSTTIGLGQPTIVTISIIGPGSTAASYGSTGAISSSPPTPAPSIASPSPESDRSHHEGTLSHGALIATIVAPIAFFLILSLGGMLFCFRRRRGLGKSHRLSNTTSTPEMFARLRLPSFAPTNPSLQVPVQFFDPRNESPFADPPTPTSAEVPVYLEPETPLIPIYLEQPSPIPPRSPHHHSGWGGGTDGLLPPPSIVRPETLSRSTTECSITSTLYSDSASVHEAREAQRVGVAANPFRTGEGGGRRYAYGRVPIGLEAGTLDGRSRGDVPADGEG